MWRVQRTVMALTQRAWQRIQSGTRVKQKHRGLSWRPSKNSRQQKQLRPGLSLSAEEVQDQSSSQRMVPRLRSSASSRRFPAYHSLCCMPCSISCLLSPSIIVLGQPKPLLLRLLWSPLLCPWVRAAQQSPIQLNLIITLSQFKYFNHATS